MKGKKRLIALLLSFLMVMSQMSVATFALDTVAADNSDQAVTEQAVEETQPDADVTVAAVEKEPVAEESATETATEPEAAEPAAAEPEKTEPAAEPAKAEAKKAEPKKEEPKEEAFDQSKTVDGVKVTVKAAKGVFPAGSKLSVSSVSVPSAVDTEDAEKAYAFDISILADGKKIQPDGNATVSFTTEEVAEYDTAVYHMDGGAQEMNVSESGNTASVKTDGFSVYVVTFQVYGHYSPPPVHWYKDNGKIVIEEAEVGDEFNLVELYTKSFQAPSEPLYEASLFGSDNSGFAVGGEGNESFLKVTDTDDDPHCTVELVWQNKAKSYMRVAGEEKFKVTFNLDGGKIGDKYTIDPQYISSGEKVTDPGDPTKEGRTFEGWFIETPVEKEYDFDTDVVTGDMELKAHYSHEHVWDPAERSDDKSTLIYKCLDQPCPIYEDNEYEAVLSAEDVIYSGQPYDEENIDLTLDDNFPEECDVEKVEVVQWKKGSETLTGAPTDAGTYSVQVKVDSNGNTRYLWATFEIKPLAVNVTADDKAKYVRDPDPEFTFTAVDGTGAELPEAIYNELKSVLTIDRSIKNESAGTYPIDICDYDDTEKDNFDITFTSGLLTIKSTSDVPVGLTHVYNGGNQELVEVGVQPDATKFLFGIKDNPDPADPDEWTDKIPTEKNVGDYTIYYVIADEAGKILDPTDQPGKVEGHITPATLTVTAEDYEGVYDGNDHPTEVKVKGLLGEDSASNIRIYYNVGEPINPSQFSKYTKNPPVIKNVGEKKVYYYVRFANNTPYAGNYVFDPEQTGNSFVTLKVTAANITVTAKDDNITYGDEYEQGDDAYTIDGLVTESHFNHIRVTLTPSKNGEEYEAGDPADVYDLIPTVTGDADVMKNYTVDSENGFLTVSPKKVTFKWMIEKEGEEPEEYTGPISYDGYVHAMSAELQGVLPEDEGEVAAHLDGVKEAKNCSVAGYTVSVDKLTGAKKDNYTFDDASLDWNIEKKIAYIQAAPNPGTPVEILYGDEAWYEGVVYIGIANPDLDSYGNPRPGVITGPIRYTHTDSPTPGEGEPYVPGSPVGRYYIHIDLSQLYSTNYELVTTPKYMDVKPLPVSVQWGNTVGLVYNGKDQKPGAYVDNAFGDDEPQLTIEYREANGTVVDKAVDAGPYAATVTGVDDPNYTVDGGENLTKDFTINKATVTVTANNQTIYYRDDYNKTAVSYSGFVNGEDASVLTTAPTVTSNYYVNARHGSYVLAPVGAAAKNYTFRYANGKLTVNGKITNLVARATNTGNRNATLSWNKVTGAARYDVYFARCNAKGKLYRLKKVATVKSNSYSLRKLTKGVCYKFVVIAKSADGKTLSKSNEGHFIAGNTNGSETNASNITTNRSNVTLSVGKTFKLKVVQSKSKMGKKLLNGGHSALVRYRSDNTSVATVSSNGTIKAVGKGYCRVYVQATNGMWKTVEVTVN